MTASFESFVVARGQALWRTAWLLTGDPVLAQDLVQTSLAKAWRHYARVDDGGGGFEAYVRRILVTTYATWWRRRWHGERPVGELPEVAIGDGALGAAVRHDVLAALATLPPRQRAVVVLRYFEDLTEVQTAQRMGCSLGSVKTHHARALRTLRGSPLLSAGDEPVTLERTPNDRG